MVWNGAQSPLYKSVERYNSNADGVGEEDRTCGACENQPRLSPKSPPKAEPNPLGRILGDRDSLLIIALIILLWHEKADMKLIAALAFILLG